MALFGLPDEIKHCAPEPMPPQHGYNALQAAQYVVDLREAGRDCRKVVQQINSIF